MVFFFLVFFQNSMAMVFFFLVETSKLWSYSLWFFPKLPKLSSSSWLYLQSHGLLLPGFFQNSQSCCLLLHGFSKAPKVVLFLFVVFFQNSIVVVFFFMAETLKLWSSFSWFFPKFPNLSSSSWPYPQSHGLLLPWFFQSSQSCFLLSFSQSSIVVVFLCYFWLLVSMPIVLFSSVIICNFEIFEFSHPYPPHCFLF